MNTFNFAVIVPMANEQKSFDQFIESLSRVLDILACGRVYLIVDTASIDNTLNLCTNHSMQDKRFETVWAPENKNVVDAYIRGYKEAFVNGHQFIIEMDAGLSHNPDVLPIFLKSFSEGYDCVYGSRFIKGGLISDANAKRKLLSKGGTILSNLLLGTKFHDMTSGYQGFKADVVGKFIKFKLKSKAHFYQTELRYLLRKANYIEIPIHYKSPSPSVSKKSIYNSLAVLFYYFILRLRNKAPAIN